MRILSLLLLLTLSACGGGGSDSPSAPVTPPTGDTGGSNDPAKGTRLRTRCEGTTKVIFYADGNGGEYREEFLNDEKCGYVDLSVELDGTATYFTDVTVTVTGTADWDYSVSIGNVEETDTGLRIWSDGRLGKGTLTINGEEYYYDVEAEPVCATTSSDNMKYRLDCMGYYMSSGTQPWTGLIYYGEEDSRIVTIETSVAIYSEEGMSGPISPEHPKYQETVEGIRSHNEWFQSQGIWIELKLVNIVWGQTVTDEGADLIIEAEGAINCPDNLPSCIGSTFQTRGLTIGATLPRRIEVIRAYSAITRHEIGHAFGLGHGISANDEWNLFTNNTNQSNVGSFFPTFGHGWYSKNGVCGGRGSFMTYSSSGVASNSLLSCKDLYPTYDPFNWYSAWGEYAGNREMGSDEAYAMNRVRYNVSLIHNEHSVVEASPLLGPVRDEVEEVLIVEPNKE